MTRAGGVVTLLLVGLLGGCHSSQKSSSGGTLSGRSTEQTKTGTSVTDELSNPASPLAKRSVYFAFDSDDINGHDQSLLQAHAQYLRAHPDQHILVQGNTDERGTDEYNLALGQQRSQAVVTDLETLGVSASQMEAVSLGKEKPLATGHDEAAWAQNRRVDLSYR